MAQQNPIGLINISLVDTSSVPIPTINQTAAFTQVARYDFF